MIFQINEFFLIVTKLLDSSKDQGIIISFFARYCKNVSVMFYEREI